MRRHIAPIAAALLLAACGSDPLPPFDTIPAPAPSGFKEDFSRVGVCYNRQTATQEQVTEVARANCEPGTTPVLLDRDLWLTCPLLTPARATYACIRSSASLPPR